MARAVGVQFSIGASLQRTVASSFGTVASRIKGLRSDLSGLQKQSLRAKSVTVARSELLTAKTAYHADPTGGARTALDQAARAYKNAAVAARSYGVDVRRSAEQHVHLREQIARTEGSIARHQQLQANQKKRKELQGQILGTVASAMVVTVPVKLALDFESTFADLKKGANFVSAEQEKLVQQDIFDVARRTGINAAGVTQIAVAASETPAVKDANGKMDREKLKQFLSDAAEMSVAYGISAEEAGKRLAAYQSRMELSAEQTRGMGDAMNYLASKMAASAADTSSVVASMGGVGKMAGLSEKSIAGLAGALVSTSENKETAGTAMKSFLLTLSQGSSMTKQQKEAFAGMGIHSVKALAEGMKKGGPEAERTVLTVLAAIQKMPEATQAGIAKEIFGTESLASLAPLINNLNVLKKAFDLANSTEAIGSQLAEFNTRSETTGGALERLRASVGILGITVGSVLLPPIATAAEYGVKLLKPVTALATAYPEVTQAVMLTAGALVALKVATLAGGYAATVVSDAWNKGKSAVDFFRHGVSGSSHALARHHAATVRSAGATQRTTAPLQQSSVAFRAQARAANTASSSLRRMGGAWKMAFGPVGLILAGLEAIYNSFGCVKQGVDAFIETVASIPVVGPAFKAVANALGFGADSEEEAAEAKARGEKSLARINNTIKTESGALGDLYSQGFTNPMLPLSNTGVSTTEQGVKVQTPPVEARTVSSQAEAKKASGWSEAWNSGLTQEKPMAGLDLYTSGFPTAFTAPVVAKPTQPAVVQTTQATPKATTTQALKAIPSPVTAQTPQLKTVLVTDPTPQNAPSPVQTRAARQSTPTTALTAPATAKVTQPAVVQTTQATPKTTTTQALKAVPSPVTVQTPPLKTVLVTDPTPQSVPSPAQTRAPRQSTPAASAVAPVGMPSAPSVMLTQEISLNGISDGDFARRVVEAINARKSDVERLLSSIVDDQRRLAYGG